MPPGIDQDDLATLIRVSVLTLQEKFPEALQLVHQIPKETLPSRTTAPCPKAFLEGALYLYQGDKVKAQAAFETARIVAEQLVQESPDDAARHGQLGLILAGLGRKEEAIKEGKRAVELLPEAQDALDGPEVAVVLAQIYAWTGEHDQAFELLDHLLQVPNSLTVPILKVDPVWDPLRNDPRFEKLVASPAPKTAGK